MASWIAKLNNDDASWSIDGSIASIFGTNMIGFEAFNFFFFARRKRQKENSFCRIHSK